MNLKHLMLSGLQFGKTFDCCEAVELHHSPVVAPLRHSNAPFLLDRSDAMRQNILMDNPVTSWAELQATIAALPSPKQGMVRVYRGQTADYPTLLPSRLRQPTTSGPFIGKEAIWFAYA